MQTMELVDTHCHIHEARPKSGGDAFVRDKWAKGGFEEPTPLIEAAQEADVTKLICVGTTLEDSRLAIKLAEKVPSCFASIGIHPHEAKDYPKGSQFLDEIGALATQPKVISVGECGLDYYYGHSSKDDQKRLLEFQIELALKHDLPLIFHVRDAFDDFWPIFDAYEGLRGVIHSFSATTVELEQIVTRGLYVGLNGIMTFTKDKAQLAAAKAVPLDKLLLETDAPFLTPVPFRGKICQPKHVRTVAEFLAELRGESPQQLANATTANAHILFGI